MAKNNTLIEFNNVSKRFVLQTAKQNSIQERVANLFRPRARGQEYWALRNISFRVEPGQSLGLVGHNGAGKSTMLKLMTRILEPTSGTVRMQGRVAALLELGSGFHPDLSGRENVFLNGSLMGFSRRQMQEKLDEIIDFAEIGDFIDMEVKHYSSGMYTRLAFAVATAVDPEILITDEVLAVGDETFQRKCMERIYQFREQGKTIIFVSHALETVRLLCDVGIWLDHGRALAVGPASEVIDSYLADVNKREGEARRKAAEKAAEKAGEQVVEIKSGEEAEEPKGDPRRRGSLEAEITKVEFLDTDGLTRQVYPALEPVTIRMHYVAHKPLRRPVFGIGIYHENGFWLTGPNTRFDDFDIPEIAGKGYVDFVIPQLTLLSGRYQVSAVLYDEAILHPYDSQDRMHEFIVRSDGLRERYGVISLGGHWNWQEEPA